MGLGLSVANDLVRQYVVAILCRPVRVPRVQSMRLFANFFFLKPADPRPKFARSKTS